MPGDGPITADDILGTAPPAPAPTPAPAPDPIPGPGSTPAAPRVTSDDLLDIQGDADRLKAATSVGLERDPARSAKLIDLQTRTGLPTALIDRNLDAVDSAVRQRDFNPDEFRRSSPVVAQWLAEDPARVGLTRNDLPGLAAVEALVRSSPEYRYQPDGSIIEIHPGSGYANYYAGPGALRQALIQRGESAGLAQMEAEHAQQRLRDSYGPLANVVAGGAADVAETVQALHRLAGTDTATARQYAQDITQASQGLSPGLWGDIQRGVGGMVAQLPLMVLGGPVAKAVQGLTEASGFAKVMSPLVQHVLTGAATMQPLAIRGALNDQNGLAHALGSWAIDSGIAGAFGPVGAGRAAARFAGAEIPEAAHGAAALVLQHTGLAAGQNLAFDLAHRIQDYASGADPSALDWDKLTPSLMASGVLGALTGGVFSLPEAMQTARTMHANLGMQQVNPMASAARVGATLRDLGEQVHATQAMQLNQDAIAGDGGLLQKLASGTGLQTLYVDAQAWRDHFGAPPAAAEGAEARPPVDPRALAATATGDPNAYDKAIAAGSHLAIPLEKFVPLLQDEAHRDWLTQEARQAPEAMNEREARELAVTASKKAEAQAQEAGPGSREADLAASADLVREDIKRQQVAAGIAEPIADRNAELWRAVMHTAAARGWTDAMPHELYQQFKVRVARAMENGPMRDAIDAAIARLKAGDIPTEADIERSKNKLAQTPNDVLDKIKELGGVTAGDTQEHDDRPAGFPVGKHAPDQMATMLRDAGIGDGHVTTMWKMVKEAKETRGKSREALPTEDSDHLAKTRDNLLNLLEHFRAIGADVQNEPADQLKARLVNAERDAAAPDGAALEQGARLNAPESGSLHKADLRELWRKAHGDREPDTSSKAWRDLVAESRAVDAERGLSFAQTGGEKPKGTFLPQRLSAERESLIRILKGADRSTFLHETGHFLLEFMHDLAGRADAPDALKDDLGKIRDWLGAKEGEAISREQHELFARGFERYLMEGKAPSAGLRGAFERFKRWLVDIYRQASALHVHLSDDVRQVFDRILASDEAIAHARGEGAGEQPLFADQAESGMPDAQWGAYLARVEEGKARARELLEREVMGPLRAEETKTYQAERAKKRLEIADQVNREPTYTALLVLQKGAWPEGIEISEGAERVKLDKRDLVERYGDAALDMLPGPGKDGQEKANRGRRLYTDDGSGISLDEAAELFGFKDGGELWHALVNAPDRTAEIERRTDAAMRSTHPDPMQDGSLDDKARLAVLNDPRLDAMEREAAAIAHKAGRPATPSELLRTVARAQIGKTKAMDLRPSLYRVAMNRAGRAALKATLDARHATDPTEKARLAGESLDHKQNEILQTHLYREASKAVESTEQRREYNASWDDLAKRQRIGKAGGWEWTVEYRGADGKPASEAFSSKDHGDDPAKAQQAAVDYAKQRGGDVVRTGYLEQGDAIREAYDLKRVSNAALQRREGLRDFIARKLADDEPVDIPEEVVADLGTKNWRELTIDQQAAVTDALKNLEHLAGMKNRLLTDARREAFAEVRDANIGAMTANSRGIKVEKAVGRGILDNPVDAVGRWFSSHATVARLCREMDGYKDGGAMFETWLRKVNDANDTELKMKERSTKAMAELVKQWGKLKAGNVGLSIRRMEPAIGKSISHWGRIMAALNWGNADNRARLLQGEGWSVRQAEAVMAKLDKSDMRFVQGILDHINTYWPEIKAKQERVTGIAPQKVEATPIIHGTGVYAGGYFPIAYDPRSMPKGRDVSVEAQAMLTRAGARLYATTQRGHTEARTGMAEGARLLLDPGVITRHLDNVAHDLAYHETLIDLNRLLRDKDLRQTMLANWGVDAFRQFQSRLTDIAAGVQGTKTGLEQMLEWSRQGVNFANRAVNLGMALQQGAGIVQSLVRVGPKYWAQALGKMFRNPMGSDNVFRWVDDQSTMMRNRSKTFDKNVADAMVGVSLKGPIRKTLDTVGYYFWTKAFQILDTHTWLASYLKAMDEQGGDEGKAKAIADQTVTDVQGSGAAKDMPAIMRGGALGQVFTSNMSWWLANYNLTAEAINRAKSGKPADILKSGADLFVLYGVQVAAWSALGAALTGKGSDEWQNAADDPGALAKSLTKDAAYTGMSSMVLLRDLADVVLEGRQYRGPQGLKSMSLIASAMQSVRSDQENASEARSVAKAAGIVLHLPIAQVVDTAEGLAQAQQDGSNPLWPALFGPRATK